MVSLLLHTKFILQSWCRSQATSWRLVIFYYITLRCICKVFLAGTVNLTLCPFCKLCPATLTFWRKYDIFNTNIIVVQYPSQYGFSESGPKNPPNGTSMKFLVFCFERPVRGWCWELRFRGGFQRHGYPSPFSVEAYDCGGPDLLREQVVTA